MLTRPFAARAVLFLACLVGAAIARAQSRAAAQPSPASIAFAREIFRARRGETAAAMECHSPADAGQRVLTSLVNIAKLGILGRAASLRTPPPSVSALERCGWRVPRDGRVENHNDRWAFRWTENDDAWPALLRRARASGESPNTMRALSVRGAQLGLGLAALSAATFGLFSVPHDRRGANPGRRLTDGLDVSVFTLGGGAGLELILRSF